MNWLDKLERKFGRYAIPNLTVYLLVAYVIGFGIVWIMPDLVGYITLEPALILRGQVWRLITWILVPPTTNLVSLLFLVLLYYSLGTALEHTWGSFRYNVYIFSGLIFTVLAEFGLYVFFLIRYGVEMQLSMIGMVSTNYITMSIFLAFAAIYPDMEVMLYFILPIKMKWMALVYVVMAAYYFVRGGLMTRVAIGASSELCDLFPLKPEREAVRTAGAGEKGEVQAAVRPACEHALYQRGEAPLCGMRADGA